MANRLRFRSGQVQLHKVRVSAESVIEAGDLLFLQDDQAQPASALSWDTNLATTQAALADVFLGIAHQPSPAGEAEPISVDISPVSVYEFDVASSTYGFGDRLGADAVSSTLRNQQLVKVSTAAPAIARAVESRTTASNRLRVSFASAFHTGSANVNAVIG